LDEQNRASSANGGDAYINSQETPCPPEYAAVEHPDGGGYVAGQDLPESGASPSRLREEDKPVSKGKKIRQTISNVLFIAFMGLLSLIVLFTLSPRIAGSEGTIFGYSIYVVRSNSMHPTYSSGSVVFVKERIASEVKERDVITFWGGGENVTHRVVAINHNPENDYYSFITKGDANNAEDPQPVPFVNLRGVVLFGIPYLGHLLTILRPPNLGLLIVVIPCFLIIVVELAKLVRLAKESNSKQ